ncbi:MAG: methylmalonyl-CoA carboxyltransferase [Firmicutes bacterium]|jgi:acetyl-CoA carboxylase carboxyltransferase component|nr:methylmalonyl-CoA carboxyltransferase [Bacillota bacterium]
MDKLNELMQRRAVVEQGGGERRIQRQHSAGKKTARERIDYLFDADSFIEIDAFVTHRCTAFGMENTEAPGEGVVTGYGTIDGRLVYVAAQDFTVIGGSLGEMHAAKICKVMDLAVKMGAPFVSINDSGGARIQEGVDSLQGYGDIFYRNSLASGVIPQISVIMGPCAGGAVYSPALTDFILMTKYANMFITGPQVVQSVTGEEVTADTLGGSSVHASKSGVAHFVGDSDEETLDMVRILVGFIPSNNLETTPVYITEDSPVRTDEILREIIPESPNRPYDMRDIMRTVVDDNNFFEVHKDFAANMITGFGRLNGRSVGIVGNQPKVMAGCLDINASDKASRFIRFCDSFNIPLVTFTDTPGYLPGVDQEHNGVIRHGAKLLYAYSEANVPKLTVITRKAYGGAYIAMCSRHLGADMVYALPNAEIAVMGPEGAANIIFRNEIRDADDPMQKRQEKIDEYRNQFANPYVAAGRGFVDDVIDPALIRPTLINALEMCITKREGRPAKKHGNIPL